MEKILKNRKLLLIVASAIALIIVVSLIAVIASKGGNGTKKDNKTPQQKDGSRADKIMDIFMNPDGRMLCVSKQGDTASFPENSYEGIKSAIKKGADIIEINISRTSDGYLVLIKDEDFSRMCVDPEGNTIDSKVSETESWEVIGMCLRQGRGGNAKEPTECHPQTLEGILQAFGKKAVFLLDFDEELLDEVYNEVEKLGSLNRVIFKLDSSSGTVKKFLEAHREENLAVMGEYDGNIVFSARSYTKDMIKYGAKATLLSVKNANGVIFHGSVLDLYDGKIRAAIDVTSPEKCGEREDDETGWNDLASRGYSVIATDYPDRLSSFIELTEQEKAALSDLVEKTEALNKKDYSEPSYKRLKKEIDTSKQLLESQTSKKALNEQYYKLNSAYEALDAKGENEGVTVSLGRIIAIVFAVALFVFAQWTVYKHSSKRKD